MMQGNDSIVSSRPDGKDDDGVYRYHVSTEEKSWGDILEEDKAGFDGDADNVPSEIWVRGIEDVPYTGMAVTFPGVRVYWGKNRLAYGTDYTVKYANNTKAGTATLTISGKGNYAGTIVETFHITPLDIADAETADVLLAYNRAVQKGKPSVVYHMADGRDVVLKEGTDYTCYYLDQRIKDGKDVAYTDAGTDQILLTGKGNYTGRKEVQQTIREALHISKAAVRAIPEQTYTGGAVEPVPDISYKGKTLESGKDYSIAYSSNVKVGTATATITGLGDYTGTRKVTFKIKGIPVSGLDVVYQREFVYTGSEIRPAKLAGFMVYEKALGATPEGARTINEHYTVSYTNNIKAGTGTMIIKGEGSYTGTLRKQFRIAPYEIKENDARVKADPIGETVYQKGGSRPVVAVRDTSTAETLVAGRDYTVSYSNHTGLRLGTDQAPPTVKIKGKGNYSGSISLTYDILARDIKDVYIRADDVKYREKANICKPAITLTEKDGKKLTAGTDYERKIEYTYAEKPVGVKQVIGREKVPVERQKGDPVDPGDIVPLGTEIRASVTGCGNYTGTQTVVFRCVRENLSSATVTVKPQIYTGMAVQPSKDSEEKEVVVRIGKTELKPTDYDIIEYTNNIEKGSGRLTVRGRNDYGGTKTVSFKIYAKSMCYTVVYEKNADDATGAMKDSVLAVNARVASNAFYRKGYTFAGWATTPDGEVVMKNRDRLICNAEKTYGTKFHLYAVWEPVKK